MSAYARSMCAYALIIDFTRQGRSSGAGCPAARMQLSGAAPGDAACDAVLRPASRSRRLADDPVLHPRQAQETGADEHQRPRPRARHGPNDARSHDVASGARRPHPARGRFAGSAQQEARDHGRRHFAPSESREPLARGTGRVRATIRCRASGGSKSAARRRGVVPPRSGERFFLRAATGSLAGSTLCASHLPATRRIGRPWLAIVVLNFDAARVCYASITSLSEP